MISAITILLYLGLALADQPNAVQRPNQVQGSSSLALSSSSVAQQSKSNLAYDAVQFNNVGYDGYYFNVESFSDIDNSNCDCVLSTDQTSFEGTNAPLNEELSVHFRGPLILHKFAYYISDGFEIDGDSSLNWTRLAHYDDDSQIAQNVTFLTAAGDNSTCLGKALTYADSDGVSELSSSTILSQNTLINSDDEFIIFTNQSCEDSGANNDCGFYRDGIPLYHGYYGDTKMFLFEFEMPTESVVSYDDVLYYDMPAIWLLNSRIPRTSQYPTNSNCSCWGSGCGEFDIFESLNSSELNHLYSTIHDYQGTGLINYGLALYGYIPRETDQVMRGGVVFDANGTISVFLSNDTTFDETIVGTDLVSWVSNLDTVEDTLDSVASSDSNKLSNSIILLAVMLSISMFIL